MGGFSGQPPTDQMQYHKKVEDAVCVAVEGPVSGENFQALSLANIGRRDSVADHKQKITTGMIRRTTLQGSRAL